MKSRDLLSQLSSLESKLGDFSFEELTSSEASHLKKSFQAFKKDLEDRIWGETPRANQDEKIRIDTKAEVSKLIANVSHELRTPLNGIVGFANLLRESKLNENQEEYVNAIQSASTTLLDIISELLAYARTTADLGPNQNNEFNFRSLVKDVLYLASGLLGDKSIKIEVDLETAIPEVLIGDAAKLSQILLNLYGNAVKFVEKGEINLKINCLNLDAKTTTLSFALSDTGIGIAADKLKNIFTPYRQAESDTFAKYGGSGLGLSIVQQIVKDLNGDISVQSELGVGTTFTFNLPFKIAEKPTIIDKNNVDDILLEHLETVKGMHILVFEDNELNQRLIEQRLKKWECKPQVTDNAILGMNILKNSAIDLVLMDLRMPDVDGFEMTRRIRASADKTIRKIPIIALSADFSMQDQKDCKSSGINDFILKPYSPDELLLKITSNKLKTKATEELPRIAKSTGKQQRDIVNLNPLLEECMGDIEVLEELISLYHANALEFIGKSKLFIKNEDFEGLQFASHKIKSGLAMLQTFNLNAIVEQIHKVCRTTKDINHIEYLYHCFIDEYPLIEEQMTAALKEIRSK